MSMRSSIALGVGFLAYLTCGVAAADESPLSIGYYCGPDTQSIVDGQYYLPQTGVCTYLSSAISGGVRYGAFFRGIVGSSTVMDSHSLGLSGEKTEYSDLASAQWYGVQPGEDVFIAIYRLNNPITDHQRFVDYFTTGSTTPPHQDFGYIRFKWGTPPEPPHEPDPVIIIPGILGSQEKDGVWLIDPILHTYDDLIATLDVNGYTPDVDLFTFPYNWRKSNVETAVLLKEKIDAVKEACDCEKVDLVAHSMGGLVARQYIQSDAYEGDVDQLIFLGTPHLGAPKAYLMWEGGELGPRDIFSPIRSVFDELAERVMMHEAYENGYETLFAYIQNEPIASVRELLPIYSYIFDALNLRGYPLNYPANAFLEGLKADTQLLLDSGVEIHNIIGDVSGQRTITGIRAVDSSEYEPLWPDGFPEDYYSRGDHGLERGSGDGTVPFASASFIGSGLLTTAYSHNSLPLETAGEVYRILTGRIAGFLSREYDSVLTKLLHIKILSPADLLVIAPDGKKIGKENGAEINEISGAFYTGFNTDTEFITILQPLDGEYKVIAQGTGSGAYTIETSYIDQATTTDVAYTGSTTPGLVTELQLQFDADNPAALEIIAPDVVPPVITIASPLAKDYPRSQQLAISVTAADESGVQLLETKLGTTTIPNIGTLDLFFQKLGSHTLAVTAADTFGNATTSTRTFRVVATATSTIADLERAYALGWVTKKVRDELTKKLKAMVVIRKTIKNITQMIVETGRNGKKTTKTIQQKVELSEEVLDKLAAKAILKELDKYRKKGLDERVYQLLKEDIHWLINN